MIVIWPVCNIYNCLQATNSFTNALLTNIENIPSLNLPYIILEKDIIIIDTLFDPEDPVRKWPPFHNNNPNSRVNKEGEEEVRRERKKSEKALVIKNIDKLKYRVYLLLFYFLQNKI